MSKTAWTLVVIAALAVFGALFFYRYRLYVQQQAPAADTVVATPAVQPPAPPPPTHYPVPAPPPTAASQPPSLPTLENSDSSLRASLEQLVGKIAVEKLLNSKTLIQNLVLTINSLDHDPVPQRVRPWRAVPGHPAVHADGGNLTLSADNAQRYAPYMALVKAINARQLASVYLSNYPLFQQAYQQQGYPDGYFNDRLIAVIDHLLAAPDVQGPIQVVQPKVLYEFADPQLEQLSWGQKIVIRIGAENEALVKA
ncbi:MAG: DUF3014 domain-containing protein, partial [Stenotrophobium sp.]